MYKIGNQSTLAKLYTPVMKGQIWSMVICEMTCALLSLFLQPETISEFPWDSWYVFSHLFFPISFWFSIVGLEILRQGLGSWRNWATLLLLTLRNSQVTSSCVHYHAVITNGGLLFRMTMWVFCSLFIRFISRTIFCQFGPEPTLVEEILEAFGKFCFVSLLKTN